MVYSLLLLATLFSNAVLPGHIDFDRDGLSDHFEQAILKRFEPTFLLNTAECDVMPAEFQPGIPDPQVIGRNGTIYGQAFPTSPGGLSGVAVELHYYHLWSRDCGRGSHALDAEHVSVLVQADDLHKPVHAWKALYWYAAAHEGTLCDGTNGANASGIGAEYTGASVWISRGKHGSFLSPELCSPGCGSDDCRSVMPMPRGKLINIGELRKPMLDSIWVASRDWPLLDKMDSDFTPAILSKLSNREKNEADGIRGPIPPVKALLLAGNSTFTGAKVGTRETGEAIGTAAKHTHNGMTKALSHTGRALWRVLRIIGSGLD